MAFWLRAAPFLTIEVGLLCSAQIVSIVDDDEAVRLATESLVRSFGRQTRLFASAEEFLQSGYVAETSCLISDVMMPGMSGVAMHDRILELGFLPPTIFITAFPTAELMAKAKANGALAVLEKPVDPDAIAHWLSVALDLP
ncbi:Response regulator receiver domain-containing protein [Cupriavidus sp. YR651]|nr:Response regulator receiver domain-containing protein [Cupriavidus sp. YR651]